MKHFSGPARLLHYILYVLQYLRAPLCQGHDVATSNAVRIVCLGSYTSLWLERRSKRLRDTISI